MCFNSYNNNKISSKTIWMFISFTWNYNFLLIRKSRWNNNINNFMNNLNLLSSTGFTLSSFVYYFSFTLTRRTWLLCLSIHTWSKLNHFNLYSLSFTFITSIDFLTSFSITFFTDFLSFSSDLQYTTFISLFQSYLFLSSSWSKLSLLFLSLLSWSTSKEMTKNIIESPRHTTLSF